MSLFFLFNNIHFALEILGALAFGLAGWLALDAFTLRRNKTAAFRIAGFGLLTVWQLLHSFNFGGDLMGYVSYAAQLLGLVFVLGSMLIEKPLPRPSFNALILTVPSFSAWLSGLNAMAAVGYGAVAFLAYRQYSQEYVVALKNFWLGFLFLALGSLLGIFYGLEVVSVLWAAGHLLELAGFFLLGWWAWQYLQLRLQEQLTVILGSMLLVIATVVTLAFSTILVGQIEAQTKVNLVTDNKVLELTTERLKEEALAKARLLASRTDIRQAISGNDFAGLERLGGRLLETEKLGFLTFVDKNGVVILRAHAGSQREDDISKQRAVEEALASRSFVTIESSPAEKFAIQAGAPIVSAGGNVIGAVIAGFPLDNALLDSIKRITGLDMSVFDRDVRVASTLMGPDGRTRNIGLKIGDVKVVRAVLDSGREITLRTTILSRPFLASYLPLRNADQVVVGMLGAAKPQQAIADIANATNRLTLLAVSLIMLVLSVPLYRLTKRLTEQNG